MHETGLQMLSRLQDALPGARVYWEKEPATSDFRGSVLTAELGHRQFTMQFDGNGEKELEKSDDILEVSLVDEVVDDFVDFFTRSIYPKEKFTRIV